MVEFAGRVLFVGYGSVAHCVLPILVKQLQVPPQNITVLDFEDRGDELGAWTVQGLHWIRQRVTPENLDQLLVRFLSAGDLLIDLAWNIDCCDILTWCHDHGVLYINTSVEVWDPYERSDQQHPTAGTLYRRHMALRKLAAGWDAPGPTAVLEHGANPGLVSHFTKQGLLDIAARMESDGKLASVAGDEIRRAVAERAYDQLARKLGVRVIHVSERDTQITREPKQVGEFVNTWSIAGFHEEGVAPAELGWGTHEKSLPPLAYEHPEGPRNQICLARMGINTHVRSWVPYQGIRGMVIRHGEAFTISDRLTVWEEGRAVYRPTVHYAYCPCDAAIASLSELRGRNYRLQDKLRIMKDEILQGEDILGVLLMGHAYRSWWTGSILSIEHSRTLVPHQNATTMQVAVSVVAAASWMVQNPDCGILLPEDLPHEYVLKIAKPYLGSFVSIPSDWTPLADQADFFGPYGRPDLDLDDPWQFKNFLVWDRD